MSTMRSASSRTRVSTSSRESAPEQEVIEEAADRRDHDVGARREALLLGRRLHAADQERDARCELVHAASTRQRSGPRALARRGEDGLYRHGPGLAAPDQPRGAGGRRQVVLRARAPATRRCARRGPRERAGLDDRGARRAAARTPARRGAERPRARCSVALRAGVVSRTIWWIGASIVPARRNAERGSAEEHAGPPGAGARYPPQILAPSKQVTLALASSWTAPSGRLVPGTETRTSGEIAISLPGGVLRRSRDRAPVVARRSPRRGPSARSCRADSNAARCSRSWLPTCCAHIAHVEATEVVANSFEVQATASRASDRRLPAHGP